jgi:hypothetical protein
LWLSPQGAALRWRHFVWSVIRVRLICVTGWKIFFSANAMFFGLIAISVGLIAIFVGLIAILVSATGRFVSLYQCTKFKGAD